MYGLVTTGIIRALTISLSAFLFIVKEIRNVNADAALPKGNLGALLRIQNFACLPKTVCAGIARVYRSERLGRGLRGDRARRAVSAAAQSGHQQIKLAEKADRLYLSQGGEYGFEAADVPASSPVRRPFFSESVFLPCRTLRQRRDAPFLCDAGHPGFLRV